MQYRINQDAVKGVRERSPHNQLAAQTPTFRDHYESGGPFYHRLAKEMNWEGRASAELREMLTAGCFPDEGESAVGKTRRLH